MTVLKRERNDEDTLHFPIRYTTSPASVHMDTDRPHEIHALPTRGVSDHGPVSSESSGSPIAADQPRTNHTLSARPTHADQPPSSPLPTPGPSPLLPTSIKPSASQHTLRTDLPIREDTELVIDTTRTRSPGAALHTKLPPIVTIPRPDAEPKPPLPRHSCLRIVEMFSRGSKSSGNDNTQLAPVANSKPNVSSNSGGSSSRRSSVSSSSDKPPSKAASAPAAPPHSQPRSSSPTPATRSDGPIASNGTRATSHEENPTQTQNTSSNMSRHSAAPSKVEEPHHRHLRRRGPSLLPPMPSLRRQTLPPRCLKRARTESDSEHSEDLSPVSPAPPPSPWSLSSSSLNDDGSARPRIKAKGEEGPRDAKRSCVRATGESRGEGQGGFGTKRSLTTATRPMPPSRSNKIGINHMDLLYETKEDKMVCRMCRYALFYCFQYLSVRDMLINSTFFVFRTPNAKDKPIADPKAPATFSTKASWAELVGHCRTAHPRSFEELEKLTPAQVAELRQRLTSSGISGFIVV